MRERALTGGALAGAGLAALGLIGTLGSDGPYLSFSELSPWVVAWAIGLFALLACAPFALHRRIAEGKDRDRRWELAVVAWGGIALAAGAGFLLIALAAGLGTGSALGAIAVVGLIECAIVVGSVLALMLTTG